MKRRKAMAESFDVESVMDILYGESPSSKYSQFISGDDGKKKIRDGEVIRNSEKDRDYTSFWRNKDKAH